MAKKEIGPRGRLEWKNGLGETLEGEVQEIITPGVFYVKRKGAFYARDVVRGAQITRVIRKGGDGNATGKPDRGAEESHAHGNGDVLPAGS